MNTTWLAGARTPRPAFATSPAAARVTGWTAASGMKSSRSAWRPWRMMVDLNASIRLISPDLAYRDTVLDALREFQAEGRFADLDLASLAADFAGYVAALLARTDAANLPPDQVPETVLWLV